MPVDPADAVTDVLGRPFAAETIPLPRDDEGEVVATLVSRASDVPTTKAVLHLHGFADYFFQAEFAEWWTARGYDFYALDLRKYGRSLRPHQTPNFITDLRDYFPELDEAWRRVTVRDGHDHVVVSAHSTGGLISGLWADERRPNELRGAVMNSPWLDLQGSAVMRVVGTPVIKGVATRRPMREIKRTVTGLYARSLHVDHEGEWEFNLDWKPVSSFTVYAGWLAAIRRGHARLHRGLGLDCPVLVLSSDRSSTPTAMGDDVHGTDIVLSVPQIRRWATSYGSHVTYIAVAGARHDVVLSRPGPRKQAYDEIGRWLAAYVAPPKRDLI
ncbi:alpha/beta hydrolase [Nocardioides sp. SYSU D00038]|uniref:alpha/beta hydrolase n=1 Tax=Nocardioides sp. SYSU D00038 TaxID=2812554 RepID=UPI0027DD0437|nr:alpha/beta hydrolase [Nocardioides sp. SYSU D00038]